MLYIPLLPWDSLRTIRNTFYFAVLFCRLYYEHVRVATLHYAMDSSYAETKLTETLLDRVLPHRSVYVHLLWRFPIKCVLIFLYSYILGSKKYRKINYAVHNSGVCDVTRSNANNRAIYLFLWRFHVSMEIST